MGGSAEWLSVMEGAKAGMPIIRRVFTVHVDQAAHRGEHAHILCNQFLVCLGGSVRVTCDDGAARSEHALSDPGRGLFIPAGVWASQDYGDNSTLLVLCDQSYDPADYLRDYQGFLDFRAKGGK